MVTGRAEARILSGHTRPLLAAQSVGGPLSLGGPLGGPPDRHQQRRLALRIYTARPVERIASGHSKGDTGAVFGRLRAGLRVDSVQLRTASTPLPARTKH
ncbi:hypothetical protein GCM10009863_35450 [Streptomyces axinellae]|uniref:Uncharacterized protein n=1 Tax=Streptomyces axinellae TaxID=552788 RepID=A0ABP6CM78_9ACTN